VSGKDDGAGAISAEIVWAVSNNRRKIVMLGLKQ
jgi:hypothetical protein